MKTYINKNSKLQFINLEFPLLLLTNIEYISSHRIQKNYMIKIKSILPI